MTVRTDPSPLKVGYDAAIKVRILDLEQQPVTGCSGRYRQFMPGMEMDKDSTYVQLEETGREGEFGARSGEFSMGGDWVLEFKLDCRGKPYRQQFVYNVPWPE